MTSNHPPITPDHVARLVMFTFGKMVDGNPYWCFLAVKPSLKAEVVGKINSKSYDINDFVDDGYGEIIVSGEGLMPPNDIVKKISAMFQIPIRDMFGKFDTDAIIAKEIERVKKELGEA